MRISGTNKIVHFLLFQVVFKLFLSSITRRVVTQSPEPEAHVLCVRAFRVKLEFRSAGFLRRGENRNTRGKTSRSGERTNNKRSPHMVRAQNRARPTTVGGECSHRCASPAPQLNKYLPIEFLFYYFLFCLVSLFSEQNYPFAISSSRLSPISLKKALR